MHQTRFWMLHCNELEGCTFYNLITCDLMLPENVSLGWNNGYCLSSFTSS